MDDRKFMESTSLWIDLTIGPRSTRKHTLHRSQRECGKRVAATLQRRLYGGRTHEIAESHSRRHCSTHSLLAVPWPGSRRGAAVCLIRRTAGYGPVRPVVWEGRSRETPPYPDCPEHDAGWAAKVDGPLVLACAATAAARVSQCRRGCGTSATGAQKARYVGVAPSIVNSRP